MDQGVLEAMEQAFLTSDPSLKLGRRLMIALQASGRRRSPLQFCTSAAVQVSGEAAFSCWICVLISMSVRWSSYGGV